MQAVKGLHSKDPSPSSPNTPYIAVAASIKLLTAVPERIWTAVEAGHYSLGAQLFLLAQHVHTGLLADAGGQVTGDKIAQWFPVIARQWATIQQLQTTLLNSCQAKLSAEKLSSQETVVDCLTAIMLLKNCNLNQLFNSLLSYLTCSLTSVLEAGRTDSARTAICNTTSCIMSSVQAVHKAFIEGSLIKSLAAITSTSSPPTMELIGLSTLGPITRYLPSPVMEFRPRLREQLKDMEREKVVEGMTMWLGDVDEKARDEASTLFQYVENVEGLVSVREGLYQILGLNRDNWRKVVKESVGKELCLWDTLYRKLVTDRVVEIVTLKVKNIVSSTKLEVEKMCSNWKQLHEEMYVWSESNSDLGNFWGKGRTEKSGLEMKCWGWNNSIQELCGGIDSGMGGMMKSLMTYTSREKSETEEPFNTLHDSENIIKQLGTISRKEIVELVDSLRCKHVKHCEKSELLLLLARLYQALLILTPNLALCIRGEQKEKDSTNQEEITSFVSKEAEDLFNLWINSKLDQFSASLSSLTTDHILPSLPGWDKVTISETGDSGQEVTSIIAIPPSPSLPFITSLLSLASTLHRGHPSSFPASSLPITTSKVVQSIISHYSLLSSKTLSQNFALQLLFDVHFTQSLLVSRDTKDEFTLSLSNIISSLEANIDPFDLSVFSPDLLSRVKQAMVRSVSGLGCLIPADRVGIISSYKTPSTTTQDSHNILLVEQQPCPRFQLLPLAPGSKLSNKAALSSAHLQLPLMADKAAIDAKKTAAGKRDRSPAHQAAASFFGSMPWFGANN